MPFDTTSFFEKIHTQNEREAGLHEQVEFELELLPGDLRIFWEEKFESDPVLYSPEVQLETIRRVRDIREGRTTYSRSENINSAEVRSTELSRSKIEAAFLEAIEAYKSRELFLGNGATAEVFGLPNAQNVCVKVITDHDAYARGGNTLRREVDFLQKLEDLEVDGVRAPRFYFHIQNITVLAYCMERFNAVNMSHLLTGLATMPHSMDIDPDEFADALREYVVRMHERGVAHNDLAPRNVMIDRETLMPRVIDFGRAQELSMISSGEQGELIARDLNSVESIREFIKGYQSGTRYKFGG